MRTTLDIPQDLIEEARRIHGYKSKTDIVILALRELIRRERLEEIKGLHGMLDIDVDIAGSRRRPVRGERRRSAGSPYPSGDGGPPAEGRKTRGGK